MRGACANACMQSRRYVAKRSGRRRYIYIYIYIYIWRFAEGADLLMCTISDDFLYMFNHVCVLLCFLFVFLIIIIIYIHVLRCFNEFDDIG